MAKKDFYSFEDARKFVHGLDLKGIEQYYEYTKSDDFPDFLPKRPESHYKGKGWDGATDWVGGTRIKYETGSKAALPIFKEFISSALYKDDFKEFAIPNGIYFSPINYDTGKEEEFNNPKAIIEAFKSKDINKDENNNLDIKSNYDKLIKFRQFY